MLNIYFSWKLLLKLSMLLKTVALVQMLAYLRHRGLGLKLSVIG